jgi:hypothetical protein
MADGQPYDSTEVDRAANALERAKVKETICDAAVVATKRNVELAELARTDWRRIQAGDKARS